MLAQDLPCFGCAQLAIDVTLRSAVGRNGEARPHAAEVDGAVFLQARTYEDIRYLERPGDAGLLWWQLRRADVGARRWSTSCGSCLARRHETSLTYDAPSSSSLGTTMVQDAQYLLMLAFAASLVEPAQCDHMCEVGGEPPSLVEVLLHDPR